jgi:lipopolysaccharide export system permease protein
MKILDRYIFSAILGSTLMVLLVFLGLYFIFTVIAEFGNIRNNYQMPQALAYVCLSVPKVAYILIPLASMVGSLAGLGGLASRSELVVFRAAGISLWHIVWSAFKPVLVLLVLSVILGEFVAPKTDRVGESMKVIARGGEEVGDDDGGYWYREDQEYIHIRAIAPTGELYGVSRFSFDDKLNLAQSSVARKAVVDGGDWVLFDLSVTDFSGKSTTVTRVDQMPWEVSLDQDLLSTVVLDPEEMSMTSLLGYIDYLEKEGLSSREYWLAVWKKLANPLSTLALVLLGVSFIFGPLRTVPMGTRIFTGVVVGFLFKLAQDLLGPSSLVFGFPPAVATLTPIAICAVLGYLMLRRAG